MGLFDCLIEKPKPVNKDISAWAFDCGLCSRRVAQTIKPQIMEVYTNSHWTDTWICNNCASKLSSEEQIEVTKGYSLLDSPALLGLAPETKLETKNGYAKLEEDAVKIRQYWHNNGVKAAQNV